MLRWNSQVKKNVFDCCTILWRHDRHAWNVYAKNWYQRVKTLKLEKYFIDITITSLWIENLVVYCLPSNLRLISYVLKLFKVTCLWENSNFLKHKVWNYFELRLKFLFVLFNLNQMNVCKLDLRFSILSLSVVQLDSHSVADINFYISFLNLSVCYFNRMVHMFNIILERATKIAGKIACRTKFLFNDA